jgi:acyl-CoA thioesterase-2
MPDVPQPESLPSEKELRERVRGTLPPELAEHFARPRPIEIRPVEPQDYLHPQPLPAIQDVWFRATSPVTGPVSIQQCVLGYASDMTLLDTSIRPHAANWVTGKVQMASLDHAIWFHEAFTMDDWVLYHQDSPSASGARGFNRGSIYTRDGRLVASVVQEGLIRPMEK